MTTPEENNGELDRFESYLDDEAKDGVNYVKPKYVELTLSKDRKQELRALLKTLNEYGLSQRDKLFLTYIMALEFDSREAMNAVVDGVSVADQHIPKKMLAGASAPKRPALITDFSQ
jgi:hypothetical protein